MRNALNTLIGLVAWYGITVSAAQADWSDFYRSSNPAATRATVAPLSDRTGMHPAATRQFRPRMPLPDIRPTPLALPRSHSEYWMEDPTAICVTEILRAQKRYGIPGNLLLGIGLQEAGVSRRGQLTVWPWAVNAAGEGRLFDTRDAAMGWVRDRQSLGIDSIDVGCMQINLRWHPSAFRTLEEGFDPVINIDYAARFLSSLYMETGDWMQAAGAYHSRTPDVAGVYLASLRRNVAVANDRIQAFKALAGARPTAPDHQKSIAADTQALQPESPASDWSHGFWSTHWQDPGGTYGIYSQDRLEPVLPFFQQHF